MDWITEVVAIGNYLEAQDPALLRKFGVRSVLSLDGSLKHEQAAELGLAAIGDVKLIDGHGNDPRVFRSAIDSLVYLVGKHPPVLVQCHAGRSRSVAVVAGYLVTTLPTDPETAIKLVTSKREVNMAAALETLLYDLGDR